MLNGFSIEDWPRIGWSPAKERFSKDEMINN